MRFGAWWNLGTTVTALLLACALCQSARADTLRIGYQRYGTLILLKERHTLEQRLASQGWTVQWKLFVAGPQLLEALNAGSLDFGITGETPPIFAQAAGAPIAYVGVEPSAPQGEAILVPPASKLQSVAELKGRRVALNKGSNVHYLLVRALEAAGLRWSDIRPVYLSPADAPAAFQAGGIDAWVIWDPYLSSAEATMGARILRDGTGLVPNRQYFIANRGFVAHAPTILQTLLAEIATTDAWGMAHQDAAAQVLADASALPLPVVLAAVHRLRFGVAPITPDIIAQQQSIADIFARLGLIPEPIAVKDAVWTWAR
jgi:sulfonate transport system substrate-binding protein